MSVSGMRYRFFLLLTAFAACAFGVRAQEVTVPERPKDYILDQTGKVTTEDRKAAVAALKPVEEQAGLGVFLVLLNSGAEEPPADVAKRLAQSWRVTADTAVVLTAPNQKPPMLIEVTGVALGGLKDDELKAMKETALAAGKDKTGVAAMLAVATALGDEVRKFRTGAPLGAAGAAEAEKEGATGHLSAWIAGGALVCCLAALVLMKRGRHHALIFPQTEPRHRFSAPHSGGNDAMVSFGKREN